ncbi:MAG: extensin family protein [Kofleriaceae bacterium]
MRGALLIAIGLVGTATAQPITSPSQVDDPKPVVKKHIDKHSSKKPTKAAKQKKVDPRANELATALTTRDDKPAERAPDIRVVMAPKIREASAANVKAPTREQLDRVGGKSIRVASAAQSARPTKPQRGATKPAFGEAPPTRVAVAEPVPSAEGRITVEQQSVALKDVKRVQYGANSMPPGFAWPASSRMRTVEGNCEAELADNHVAFRRSGELGKIVDPIESPAMQFGGIAYHSKWDKPPFVIDCQLGRMLVHLGPKLAQLGVTDVTFGSLYRNTLVRFGGKTGTALSRHALGLAMDITSFKTRDGKDHVVKTDYTTGDALLLAIEELVDHDRDFRILLTPKNDPISHADHFHLEASVDFR